MRAFHEVWAYVAVVVAGLVGLWGVGLRLARRPVSRAFAAGLWVAIGALLLQGVAGLVLYSGGLRPGTFHVFYGILIAVTLAFAYVYREQMSRYGPLSWAILMLFLMGLGIRAITTFGRGI